MWNASVRDEEAASTEDDGEEGEQGARDHKDPGGG